MKNFSFVVKILLDIKIIITLILTNSMRILIKKFENKISIKGCEYVDSIFKNSFIKSCNDSNFFLTKDTLDLSLKIFQNFSYSYFQVEHYLNNFQLDSFYKFSKKKPFRISLETYFSMIEYFHKRY
jgi:hypothetical protein